MTGLEGVLPGTLEQQAAAAAIIGGLIIVGAIIAWLARVVWPMSHRLGRFLDDWIGVEARPGFDAVPGFPERLKAVETTTAATAKDTKDNTAKLEGLQTAVTDVQASLADAKKTANISKDNAAKLMELQTAVADIQHNVKPNSGTSAHDLVTGPLKEISDFLTAHFPDWKPS